MSWTDDRVELLKKLWGEGKTAAEIASTLGDVTRNAVIGKAHRLKLSGRVSPIQQNKAPAEKTEKSKVQKISPKKDVTASVPSGQSYQLSELSGNMCRWPHGDPKEDDFGFCGERSIAGLPYCSAHAQVAYQAATRNRILKAEEQGLEVQATKILKDKKA